MRLFRTPYGIARLMMAGVAGLAGVGITGSLPAMAIETSLQYVLTLTGDVERRQVEYECEGREELLMVEYVNAAPNFLAILTIEEEMRVFSNVVSGSGARYASGPYVWWSDGAEASLYDETAETEDPVLTCIEFNNIP